MNNILALGNAACNIVDSLNEYGNYQIYKIKNEGKKDKNTYLIPQLNTAEQYENLKCISKISFLKKIKGEVTFFVCGASQSSAFSLILLESLHRRKVKIKIVYFQTDMEFAGEDQAKQERMVRNVLQEYARSGLFEEVIMVSNKFLENFIDTINVFEYYKQINDVFCSSFHMIEVFKNTKPVMSTFSKLRESCRIKTIGVSTLSCEDRMFFPFNQEVEVLYYLGINEEKLRTQGNFFRELTENIRGRMTDETKAYFGIYPTQYENDYIYVEYFSPKIQLTEQ